MLLNLRRLSSVAGALGLGAAALAAPLRAQTTPRPLDHSDYDRWQRISSQVLSPDGTRLAYVLGPRYRDGALLVRENTPQGSELSVERGSGPRFSSDGRFVVALVKPAQDTVDALRLKKTKSEKLPKDSLVVIDLQRAFGAAGQGSPLWKDARVRSFALPDEGAYVAYLLEKPIAADSTHARKSEREEPQAKPSEEPAEQEEEKEAKKPRNDPGTTLVLRDLVAGAEHRYEHVTEYAFAHDGSRMYFVVSLPEDSVGNAAGTDGVYRVDRESGAATALLEGEGRYQGLAVQDDGSRVAFVSDRDDREADQPAFTVYAAASEGVAHLVAGSATAGVHDGWWIAPKGDLSVSRSGARVFFGTAPRPEPEDEDAPELLSEDQVEVDVWNWKDPYLQPMQLLQARQERERTYAAWAAFDGGAVVQLEDEDLPSVRVGSHGDAALGLGLTDGPYRQLISWDGRYNDVYVVDVATGARRLAREDLRGRASLSPDGRWITWWDGSERAWFAQPADGGAAVNLTAGVPYPVYNLLDDHPQPPPPYGMAGWTDGDRFALVYDEHDVWAVDPTGDLPPRNVTEGVGRREGLRFRYLRLDPETDHISLDEPILLSAFHLHTKQAGYYRDRVQGTDPPVRLVFEDAAFSSPRKAKDADELLFTRQTFRDFPDLWVSGSDLADRHQVTHANDDVQAEVRWGSAELVEWTSNDGIPLQGILYKPDGFDPTRMYPMMVYFYERNSDGLHRYQVPAAGGSSINYSFYVSRGYVLFVPDIPYEIGHPGESAIDAVVPGVLSVLEQGFVDPKRIGVQGHSWGGYQIAYMVTKTNLFAAAEAGAPVANMTSAYGGIRWGSGMSRMFQYERTQSRIGGSLWEAPLLYIENSPVFSADKVRTPLLMMHNDGDTAVPWYQGIEMFVALRRLQKPVWLLNYNGQPHGLRKRGDQRDWAVRMQQFFDHYLKGEPAPVWLEKGVPATLKGKTLGLELVGSEKEPGGGS